jgi:hypothetical protein
MSVPPSEPPPGSVPKPTTGLLESDPGPLDSRVGELTGTLPDGTEYRRAPNAPAAGTVHTTPDGRIWTAVPEQAGHHTAVSTPNALQWKCLPEDFAALISRLINLFYGSSHNATNQPPLPPGKVGPELPIDAASFQKLLVAAATQGSSGPIVWQQNQSELLVSPAQMTVKLDDGLVVVSIPVSCDQVQPALVQVPFAVGGKASPAGMIVATEEKPRGPEAIVGIWGEALVAFAWQAVLAVLTKIASKAGVDTDGAGLIPAAITAGTDGLHVLTQARQTFDRVSR